MSNNPKSCRYFEIWRNPTTLLHISICWQICWKPSTVKSHQFAPILQPAGRSSALSARWSTSGSACVLFKIFFILPQKVKRILLDWLFRRRTHMQYNWCSRTEHGCRVRRILHMLPTIKSLNRPMPHLIRDLCVLDAICEICCMQTESCYPLQCNHRWSMKNSCEQRGPFMMLRFLDNKNLSYMIFPLCAWWFWRDHVKINFILWINFISPRFNDYCRPGCESSCEPNSSIIAAFSSSLSMDIPAKNIDIPFLFTLIKFPQLMVREGKLLNVHRLIHKHMFLWGWCSIGWWIITKPIICWSHVIIRNVASSWHSVSCWFVNPIFGILLVGFIMGPIANLILSEVKVIHIWRKSHCTPAFHEGPEGLQSRQGPCAGDQRDGGVCIAIPSITLHGESESMMQSHKCKITFIIVKCFGVKW